MLQTRIITAEGEELLGGWQDTEAPPTSNNEDILELLVRLRDQRSSVESITMNLEDGTKLEYHLKED